MSDFAFEALLAATLAIAWTIEIASARSMSPQLRLIANPLIAAGGWRVALLGIVIPFLPFLNPICGVMMLGPSLLVAANNLERVWLVRSIGEARFAALLEEAAGAAHLKLAVASIFGGGLLVSLAGAALMFLSLRRTGDWTFWFGLGLFFYGLMTGPMRVAYVVKLRRAARSRHTS